MQTVDTQAASTELSRLVEKAAAGEEIVITHAGKPVAKLVQFATPHPKRALGLLAGCLRIPPNFDAPLPEDVLDGFEGR